MVLWRYVLHLFRGGEAKLGATGRVADTVGDNPARKANGIPNANKDFGPLTPLEYRPFDVAHLRAQRFTARI